MIIARRLGTMAAMVALMTKAPATKAFVVHPEAGLAIGRRAPLTHLLDAAIPIDSPDEVESALDHPEAVVLDVRSHDEILESGHLKTGKKWLNVQCTPDAAHLLDAAAEDMIPDKSTPIVAYCGTGKRANKAKEVLKSKGYKHVVNAGGFSNLGHLQKRTTNK